MNTSFQQLHRDVKETFRLSLPLIAAYAGNHVMGLVDTAIVGRLGAVEIAGTGMGNSLFFLVSLLGMGVLHGLDPMAAQAIGANAPDRARRHFKEALVLSTLMVIPVSALTFGSLLLLPPLGIDAPTQHMAYQYLLGRTPGLIFFYFYLSMRGYLQALGINRSIFTATLIANVANVPASLYFTLGDRALLPLGLPATGFAGWGVLGASLATTLMAGLQMAILYRAVQRHHVPSPPPQKEGMVQMLRLGVPVTLQLLAEGGMFSVGTVLVGKFGPVLLGGHQVAMQVASFTFSMCLGVSSATAVRVGHAVGQHNTPAARRAGFAGILTGLLIMVASAVVLVTFARPLASLFARPPDVVAAAIPFLYYASMFQLFDGIQIVAGGALRGAGETQLSMRVNVLCHWVLAMPLGIGLAFATTVGPAGIWWGFNIGLFTVSVALTWSFHRITLRELKPVHDHPPPRLDPTQEAG